MKARGKRTRQGQRADTEAADTALREAQQRAEQERARLMAEGGEAKVLGAALEFLHPTFDVRARPELEAYTWWVFLAGLTPSEPGTSWDVTLSPAPSVPEIERVQRSLRAGVAAVLSGGMWEFPTPERAFLRRFTATPNWSALTPRVSAATPPPEATYQWGWRVARVGTMAAFGLAALIRRHGARLRACAVCAAPSLAVKRQIYCGPTCTKTGQRPRRENING
jgi:hypothetical protein